VTDARVNPELACGVLSFRDEPGLVDAVRSLLIQGEPAELIVVNSGGGDPGARLSAAGIDIRVVNRPDRLYPGGARNVAIRETYAPYVSFLAADCLAERGWIVGRLREHRAGAAAVASCLTNAYPDHAVAWASLLLLHNLRLPSGPTDQRVYYGLSYDRRLFERYGLFDEGLRAGEDTEFNRRIARETVVRAADVRTAHRYPTDFSAYLRDAYRRGGLRAAMLGRIEQTGPQRARIVARAGFNVARSLRAALQAPPPERGPLLRAWPLVLPGAVAYAAGAAFARSRRSIGASVRTSHSAPG